MQYIGQIGPDFAVVFVKRSKVLLRLFNWMDAFAAFLTGTFAVIDQLAKSGEYPAIFADIRFDKIQGLICLQCIDYESMLVSG